MQDLKLSDVGERQLVETVLRPRYEKYSGIPRFGDDCALVTEINTATVGTIVATTDPCPEPMSKYLGFDDLYYHGWLLSTINNSDLAAAGAKPLGLLTSLVLPNSLRLAEFERLLDGIDDSCRACGTKVVGGNLKEGVTLDLTATAIGWCAPNGCVSRTGCKEGDLVAVIGTFGLFWASVFAQEAAINLSESDMKRALAAVLTPVPPIAAAHQLARLGILHACTDNSDGLYPSIKQLSCANRMRFDLNLDNVEWDPLAINIAELLRIDVGRFAIGWGDWNLLACLAPEDEFRVSSISRECGVQFTVVGQVSQGSGVRLTYRGRTGPMARIESERLIKSSWLTTGIQTYMRTIRQSPLWDTGIESIGERA